MAKKSRTREARARRQKQQRQSQQRLIIAGIVIAAILGGALLFVSNQPTEAFIPQGLEDRYEDLQRSTSIDGYPRLGDPDAPVTVSEFSSFSCPGCEAFHDTSLDAIVDRVRTGQVLFTYIPLQTGSIPNAEGAARTALCAGQQGKFWEMHDVLFDWHTRYVNTAYSQNRLLAGISNLGLNPDTFNSCFFSQSISDTLANAQGESVTSTPTIQVNGVTVTADEQGRIVSAQEVLRAIDNATPNDWVPGQSEEDATEEETTQDTEEVEAQDADSDADETTETEDMDEESESDEMTESEMDETTDSEDMDDDTESDGDESTEADMDEATDSQAEATTEPDSGE